MKMKNSVIALIVALFSITPFTSLADSFVTAGDGTTYSFATLATIPSSGVTLGSDSYVLEGTVEISEGDFFVMDSGATIRFADSAELLIKGIATLSPEETTTLTITHEALRPYNVEVWGGDHQVLVSNLNLEFVGLRCQCPYGMEVRDCQFTDHAGTQGAALFLGPDGAPFKIEDCHFAYNQKAAIASAANYFCPIEIANCSFYYNSTANNNIPQLNLTASPQVIVKDCEVIGDPNHNMVGGIGISNFYGTEGFKVTIENNTVKDNRYGISTMGVMDVEIRGNQLIDNCHESNAMNGGSGISLYDPYMKQTAVVSGNYIENSLWGITVIGCGDVNIGRVDVDESDERYNAGGNVFKDNGNGGALYDLYNNSTQTVYAQGNHWNVDEQTEEKIEGVVFHQNDDPSLGEVIFMPPLESTGITEAAHVDGPTSIYRIDGTQVRGEHVDALPKGLYIVGGKKRVVR